MTYEKTHHTYIILTFYQTNFERLLCLGKLIFQNTTKSLHNRVVFIYHKNQ